MSNIDLRSSIINDVFSGGAVADSRTRLLIFRLKVPAAGTYMAVTMKNDFVGFLSSTSPASAQRWLQKIRDPHLKKCNHFNEIAGPSRHRGGGGGGGRKDLGRRSRARAEH